MKKKGREKDYFVTYKYKKLRCTTVHGYVFKDDEKDTLKNPFLYVCVFQFLKVIELEIICHFCADHLI